MIILINILFIVNIFTIQIAQSSNDPENYQKIIWLRSCPRSSASASQSYTKADTNGKIPYPAKVNKIAGGHAIIAVGFDDKVKLKNNNTKGPETIDAILICNS